MPRPIILGVVGDSAAGKTTITRGLVRALGEDAVNHVCTDDYHRFDRKQRAERGITPLHPACNYVDIMTQDLAHLRRGEPILKPVYRHADGTFGSPVYVEPAQFAVVEGLLGYHTDEIRRNYDVRVFLAPPEELRRSGRSAGLLAPRLHDRRGPDRARPPRGRLGGLHQAPAPLRRHRRLVPPGRHRRRRAARRRARAAADPGAPRPRAVHRRRAAGSAWRSAATSGMCASRADGPRATRWRSRRRSGSACTSPATCAPSALASSRSAPSSTGPESLALVQLLILYHLVTAKASLALGAERARGQAVGASA